MGGNGGPDTSDWRAQMAGDDTKALERLARYKSPQDVAKALCLTGTIKDCIKGIEDRIDAGVRDISLGFLAKDEQDTCRQMELAAKEVLPNFR